MNLQPQTVVLGGQEYRIGRLDLFDAMHVTRLISPFVPVLFGQIFDQVVALYAKSKEADGASAEDILGEARDLIAVCEPLLLRLSVMRRDDFESVIKTCLSCVERKTGKTYGFVMIDGNLMFADMDMGDVLQLAIRVIIREVRPMFASLTKSE